MARRRDINYDMGDPQLFINNVPNQPYYKYSGPTATATWQGSQYRGPSSTATWQGSQRSDMGSQRSDMRDFSIPYTSPYAVAAQAAAASVPENVGGRRNVRGGFLRPTIQQYEDEMFDKIYGIDSPEATGPTFAETLADLISKLGGGGGSGRTVLYDPDPESTRSQALIDAIQSGYGGMRQAEQDYLNALISQVGAQRTGAQQRAADAAAAADRTISGLVEAASMSGQNVGQVYSQAQQQVADLVGQYAAEQAARQQGAQQTLGMFGAPTEMAVPGGITPMDYLAAQQAAMGRFGAAEQAYFGGAPTRYQALGSDYERQRQTALEQALAELDAQQAQREAEVARSLSQLGIQEQQAILGQQQAEWERQARYPREV